MIIVMTEEEVRAYWGLQKSRLGNNVNIYREKLARCQTIICNTSRSGQNRLVLGHRFLWQMFPKEN